MTQSAQSTGQTTLHQTILGARRLSNYWWGTVMLMGGLGFLLAGLSSYFQVDLMPFTSSTQLVFVPQGATMCFYGSAALLISLYLWLIILWDVGGGYNEFNRETGELCIMRRGFPGKNRSIKITNPLTEVQAIRVELKDGLNPRRALYLRVKGRPEIPLTRVGQPMSLNQLENQGAELARFLEVPLEGLA